MTPSEELKQYLPLIRQILLFRYLSEAEMNKIIAESEIVQCMGGDRIISQDEIDPFFYGVIKGQFNNVSAHNEKGDVFIRMVGTGEIFGESAIFLNEKRTANVTCADKAVVIKIHRKDIVSLLREKTESGDRILMLIIYSLIKKLRDTTQQIVLRKDVSMPLGKLESHIRGFIQT